MVTRVSRIAESPGAAGPLLALVTGDWWDRAECQYVDPDLFHVEKGESTRPAKRVCAVCPVVAACLDYALATDQRHGVWGALSADERRVLQGHRSKQAA
jgi:WhiB family redox-sensing transcriptional regulator